MIKKAHVVLFADVKSVFQQRNRTQGITANDADGAAADIKQKTY